MPLEEKKEVSYDYFWDSNKDRYYNANSMSDWLLPFYRNGVFNGQMQVTANNDMSVTVAAGYGYINGKHRHFREATKINLGTASGTLHRIDNVVIRRNDTNRAITLEIVKGVNSSNPVAPALTRTETVYELKLAEIYIAAGTVEITQAEITDTRMNADVCGWVCATVKQIDFTQIQAQFDAYLTAYKKNITEWFKNIKDILSGDVAGNLQNEINSIFAVLREITESEINKIIQGTYEDDSEGGIEPDMYSRVTDEEIREVVNNAFGKENN